MRKIKLTKDQFAIVDDDDYEKLNKFKWYADVRPAINNYYARRDIVIDGKIKRYYMHRVIMNCPDNMVIDHIDHNPLNNQKNNLRIVTQQQNTINKRIQSNNSSGYAGLSFRKDTKKWKTRITFNGKEIALGCFILKCQAVKARKEAEEKYFGEYAYNNK